MPAHCVGIEPAARRGSTLRRRRSVLRCARRALLRGARTLRRGLAALRSGRSTLRSRRGTLWSRRCRSALAAGLSLPGRRLTALIARGLASTSERAPGGSCLLTPRRGRGLCSLSTWALGPRGLSGLIVALGRRTPGGTRGGCRLRRLALRTPALCGGRGVLRRGRRRAGGGRGGRPPASARLPGRLGALLGDAPGLLTAATSAGRRRTGAVLRAAACGRTALGRSALHGRRVGRGERRPLVPQHQSGREQLEMETGRGRAAHGREGLVDQVAALGEIGRGELRGLAEHPLELTGRDLREQVGALVRHGGEHDQVPHPLQQVLDEAARLVAGGEHVLDRGVERGRVPLGDGGDGLVEQGRVGEAEQRDRGGEVQAVLSGAGHQLVQHRHRVTGGAAAGAHDQRHHALADLDVLRGADLLEVGAEHLRRDEPEGVVVGAGADGADDLVRLGGREDELHMVRRLLDELEQRVEAGGGDHVGLVDDEHLEAVPHRGEGRALPQLAGVVHAAVAGRVDLDHVERAGAAACEVAAGVAGPAGSVRRPLLAVQAAGEDAGGGRLAAAARPREQVGMADPARAQRTPQGRGDVVLADHLGEGLRAVTTVQSGGHPDRLVEATHAPPPSQGSSWRTPHCGGEVTATLLDAERRSSRGGHPAPGDRPRHSSVIRRAAAAFGHRTTPHGTGTAENCVHHVRHVRAFPQQTPHAEPIPTRWPRLPLRDTKDTGDERRGRECMGSRGGAVGSPRRGRRVESGRHSGRAGSGGRDELGGHRPCEVREGRDRKPT